jgi:hypothetical protein
MYGALAGTITSNMMGSSGAFPPKTGPMPTFCDYDPAAGQQVFNQRFAALKEWMHEKKLPRSTQSKVEPYSSSLQ